MKIYANLEKKMKNAQNLPSDKLVDLKTAIRDNVRPEMALHLTCLSALPYSSIREIIRQWVGKKPQFEVISLGSASQIQMLIIERLVSKLTTTYMGDVYPRPGISPVFQRAVDNDNLDIEQWSLMTLCLRLYAGALGLKFIPTTSISNSTMAIDNNHSYQVIRDPFNSSQDVTVIKDLAPDLSFVHAWAGDNLGNAIIFPPYSENLWGCYASKNVLLTVEKIFTTERLREIANKYQCIHLPGAIVTSVSESPFGGHPGPHICIGPLNERGYDIDFNHLIEFRAAAKNPEKISHWMKEWIHDTVSEKEYLEKVGSASLNTICDKLKESYWKQLVKEKSAEIASEHPSTLIENMIWAATEVIKSRVQEKRYSTILAGQGASNLAAWLATYVLRNDGIDINLLAEAGFYGYLPKPSSPYIFEINNLRTSTAIIDSIISLGAILRSTKSLGVLGAGQIDQFGNINSTRIETFTLFGSGGANDVGSNANEVIVIIPLREGRFLNEVPYITVPGNNISVCVTTKGVFEKQDKETFVLSGYLGEVSDKDRIIDEVKEVIEWDYESSYPLKQFHPPPADWLQFLRSFDLYRYFLGRING
ncbi:MAG: CoA-transferase [Candidatus Hodarchaeales archaeon]